MLAEGRLQTELFRSATARVHAPEIHGQLAGDCDDRFLADGASGFGSFGEEREPLTDRRILRLEADQPPGKFNQRGS